LHVCRLSYAGSLNHGGQQLHHALSLQQKCLMWKRPATVLMRKVSSEKSDASDDESYTGPIGSNSGSGSDSGSGSETGSESHALAEHVNVTSSLHHPNITNAARRPSAAKAITGEKKLHSTDGAVKEPTAQPARGQGPTPDASNIEGTQSAVSSRPHDVPAFPAEETDLEDRSEAVRRLSQSVLALSSNNFTHITDEDRPHLSHRSTVAWYNEHDASASRPINDSIEAGGDNGSTSSSKQQDTAIPTLQLTGAQQKSAQNDQTLSQASFPSGASQPAMITHACHASTRILLFAALVRLCHVPALMPHSLIFVL